MCDSLNDGAHGMWPMLAILTGDVPAVPSCVPRSAPQVTHPRTCFPDESMKTESRDTNRICTRTSIPNK